MKRKIYSQLCQWKESNVRKPLILLGARQVGKTWIINQIRAGGETKRRLTTSYSLDADWAGDADYE